MVKVSAVSSTDMVPLVMGKTPDFYIETEKSEFITTPYYYNERHV
jgi:hypothetical protein